MSVEKYLNKRIGNINLKGQVFVITGANSGIGFQISNLIAKYNGKVIFACRNKQRVESAINEILKKYPSFEYDFIHFDQNNLNSIKDFIDTLFNKYPNFNSLILNAGILKAKKDQITDDGFYAVNGVNFLALVYLMDQLSKKLATNNFKHRIVFQGSCMTMFAKYKEGILKENNSKGFASYNISKLGEESLFYYLYKNNNNKNMSYALAEPGACKSNIYHDMPKVLIPAADIFMSIFFHSTLKGSLPAFLLAINYKNIDILRPKGFLSLSGYPKKGKIRRKVKRYYLDILDEAKKILNI